MLADTLRITFAEGHSLTFTQMFTGLCSLVFLVAALVGFYAAFRNRRQGYDVTVEIALSLTVLAMFLMFFLHVVMA